MATVIFYEKPGCGGNARQKRALAAAGHVIDARSLLAEPWTPARLRGFFGDLPVPDWFNPAAPDIKSGAVDPAALSADDALDLLCRAPILIRRPLLQVGEVQRCGFDPAAIAAWIGLDDPAAPDPGACRKSDAAAGGCAVPDQGSAASS